MGCSALEIEPHYCGCGCEEYTTYRRKRYSRFLLGHIFKLRLNRGERNGNWKGDNISDKAIHSWVNRNKPKPIGGLCELCHSKPYYDLSNISPSYNPDTYTRGFDNWRYLCRTCHMLTDGRLDRFFDSEEQSKVSRSKKQRAKATEKQELTKQ